MTLALYGGRPIRRTLLGYGHQSISEGDVQAVADVLRSDFLTCGPMVSAFERALENLTSASRVTAVANGTAALHVACLAAGVHEGDEVIVSPITFAASANCVLYCGGTPVFADIDAQSWNISPSAIERHITKRTKAIVAVDFSGVPVDADAIRNICEENGLVFIEDAAHSLGSTYRGNPVGSLADLTCFSFHPVKTITTGEGGAVASLDQTMGIKVDLFSKHGITRDEALLERSDVGGWYYEQLELGYNYRLSDIQAALGLSQLSRLQEFATRRRELVSLYDEAFGHSPYLSIQCDSDSGHTVRHLYCVRFAVEALGHSRREIYDALRAEGIGVNVHYQPVYWLPYYRRLGYGRGLCPQAEHYYEGAITLPLHPGMSDEDAVDVIDAVKRVVKEFSK